MPARMITREMGWGMTKIITTVDRSISSTSRVEVLENLEITGARSRSVRPLAEMP